MPQQVQDTRYGSQRRRAHLPRKTRKGHTLFGPEPPPRTKRPRGRITIDGEFLQQKGELKETSLHAKLQTWFKKGKIPRDITDSTLEIVEVRRLENNVVGHDKIVSKVNTSPGDFYDSTKNLVVKFFKDHPQNKQLLCEMIKVDPATGDYI